MVELFIVQIRLDRSLSVALTEQIKSQIVYAVATGLISVGSRLPSVRELSTELKIAPMTVAQAYRELAQEGVITARAGAGTFVADISGMTTPRSTTTERENLHQIVQGAMRHALVLGYTLDDLRQAFIDHFSEHHTNGDIHRIVIVGNFRAATESYAWEMEAMLNDLDVRVQPLLLEDLRTHLSDFIEDLQGAKLIVTVSTRLPEVRTLLKPLGCHVVGVAFRVSTETRRQLAEVLPTQRVGVVATYPEFLHTMMDEVCSYCLVTMPPAQALLGQDAQIQAMLAHI